MVELAVGDSMLGKQAEAVDLIRQALARSPSDPGIMFRAAEIYEQGGDHAAALNWLERAARAGYSIAEIQHDPTLQGLRGYSQYKQLMQQTPAQPPAESK